MSYPNGGQPGQPQQWGQPQGGGQQAWGQPQGGGQQAWGQPQGGGAGFDMSKVRPGQWIALVLPVLTILALSLNFIAGSSGSNYGYSYDIPGASGWNVGLFVFMFILFLLAAGAAAVEMFVPNLTLPFPMAFISGGLMALGALLGLIKWLTGLDVVSAFGIGAWFVLFAILVGIAGAVLEIMAGLKAPKAAAGNAQWGQPSGGQWGQPAGAAPQGQWGAPQTGGQPAQPQQWGAPQTGGQPAQPQQWGAPQTGGQPAQPQTGGQPAQPQQWGQNPQQPPQQWGNPQG